MEVSLWVEIVNKLATPVIAAVSALYVYRQYQRAQQWKASDLAAAVIEKLETDPALSLACHALDWGVGPLLIPVQYRPLFPRDEAGEFPCVMLHDVKVLVTALKPELRAETLKDPKGLVYRHCFIKLFGHLENVYNLLKGGQLRREELGALTYWLDLIHDYRYAPQGTDGAQVFRPALRKWGYDSVNRLAHEMKNRAGAEGLTGLSDSQEESKGPPRSTDRRD